MNNNPTSKPRFPIKGKWIGITILVFIEFIGTLPVLAGTLLAGAIFSRKQMAVPGRHFFRLLGSAVASYLLMNPVSTLGKVAWRSCRPAPGNKTWQRRECSYVTRMLGCTLLAGRLVGLRNTPLLTHTLTATFFSAVIHLAWMRPWNPSVPLSPELFKARLDAHSRGEDPLKITERDVHHSLVHKKRAP